MQLPDGRVQIVSYEADDYGFRPTVHYEYPHGEPHQALDIVGPPPHHHPGTWQQPSQFTAKKNPSSSAEIFCFLADLVRFVTKSIMLSN